jgi:cytochrome P450
MQKSAVRNPAAMRFDLTSQEFKASPLPTLARMREAGPLIRVRVPLFGQVWAATSYEAVNDLLRDHSRFLQNPTTAGHWGMGLLLRCLPRRMQPLRMQMLAKDEPDHRRLRNLVEQAFQRQQVESLRPRLEALAAEALDQFAAEARGNPAGVDLIKHFARPFPLSVICELLGLPQEDRAQFTHWASRFGVVTSVMSVLRALRGLSKLLNYTRAEIVRQRARPRDGLLSALIHAEAAGDRLSEDELVAMVFLLLLAGHETTLHQIAGSVLILLDHPAQFQELRADWRLAATAVPELFRYLSFAQITKPRYAREDLEFHGQAVGKGEMVLAFLAAANFDPQFFANAETLDLHRQPNRHLALGAGIHYCLGAKLAVMETEIALRQLFTRFPNLRLAGRRDDVRYTRRFGSRGLAALPVCV